MRLSGQAIAKVLTTGAGILLGTIAIMTGMIPGTIHIGMEAGTEAGILAGMALGIEAGTIPGTMATAIRITPIAATRYIMVAATQPIVRLAITLHAGHLALVALASAQAIAVQQVVDPLEPAMVLADPAHRRAECQVAATVPSAPLVVAAPLAEADHVVEAPSVEAAEVVAQGAADSDAIDSLGFIVYGLQFTVYGLQFTVKSL